MGIIHCEFCEKCPKWKFYKDEYVRYSCEDCINNVRKLIYLDLGAQLYSFEPVM